MKIKKNKVITSPLKEKIYIGASEGLTLPSKLIKVYQFGYPITHIFYVYPDSDFNDPLVIEAQRKGVQKHHFSEIHENGTKFYIFSITAPVGTREKIENFLEKQIGKGYDFLGIIGFLLRNKKFQRKDRQFCSELIYAALKEAGVNLFNYTEPEEVSPRLFVKSPLLKLEYRGIVKNSKINKKIL